MTPQTAAPAAPDHPSLDELRTRRQNTHRAMTARAAEREQAQAAVADAVATTGSAPVDWPAHSASLDSDINALQFGLAKLDRDIVTAIAGHNLAVARVAQRRDVIARQLDDLYLERAMLVRAAVPDAIQRAPMPVAFAATLGDIEAKLAAATQQVADLDAELTAAKAPLVRHQAALAA